jgi:hypothetical protein
MARPEKEKKAQMRRQTKSMSREATIEGGQKNEWNKKPAP